MQALDGTEAYTRTGSLDMSPNGKLRTRSGLTVLGDGGPITVPPDTRITIGGDGTVSAVTEGTAGEHRHRRSAASSSSRSPKPDLVRGDDGLFRTRGGAPADADPAVVVASRRARSRATSTPSRRWSSMITLARQFDMQMKLLQNAEAATTASAQRSSSANPS